MIDNPSLKKNLVAVNKLRMNTDQRVRDTLTNGIPTEIRVEYKYEK